MKKQELAPGIVLYDDIFINSFDYIQQIEESKIEWQNAFVVTKENPTEKDAIPEYDTNIRNTSIIELPHPMLNIINPENKLLTKLGKDFHSSIQPALVDYVNTYTAAFYAFNNPQILKYTVGQKFENHIDDHPNMTRRISLSYYFNDEYEGGEIEFPRFSIRLKGKKNQLLLFPSNFPYNHIVHPVTSGIRYVMVQWMK